MAHTTLSPLNITIINVGQDPYLVGYTPSVTSTLTTPPTHLRFAAYKPADRKHIPHPRSLKIRPQFKTPAMPGWSQDIKTSVQQDYSYLSSLYLKSIMDFLFDTNPALSEKEFQLGFREWTTLEPKAAIDAFTNRRFQELYGVIEKGDICLTARPKTFLDTNKHYHLWVSQGIPGSSKHTTVFKTHPLYDDDISLDIHTTPRFFNPAIKLSERSLHLLDEIGLSTHQKMSLLNEQFHT